MFSSRCGLNSCILFRWASVSNGQSTYESVYIRLRRWRIPDYNFDKYFFLFYSRVDPRKIFKIKLMPLNFIFIYCHCISSFIALLPFSNKSMNFNSNFYISASLGGYRANNHKKQSPPQLNIYIKSTTCFGFIKPLSSASFNKTYQLSYNRYLSTSIPW
jgi:hypothetical protein